MAPRLAINRINLFNNNHVNGKNLAIPMNETNYMQSLSINNNPQQNGG